MAEPAGADLEHAAGLRGERASNFRWPCPGFQTSEARVSPPLIKTISIEQSALARLQREPHLETRSLFHDLFPYDAL